MGSYQFAWRLPGVIFGALTVAVLFLLGRILFRRRTVGMLVGLFVLLDGMFFVQSRIAMNDVFTGFFILAAYLVFAWLWIERRSWTAFWLLMPVVGVLLGLALSSKWVAAYAIGALGILVLARSALGRVLLILGLIALTSVLGWMALAVPVDSGASGNLLFTMIMIGLTMAAVVVTVYHPISVVRRRDALRRRRPAGPGHPGRAHGHRPGQGRRRRSRSGPSRSRRSTVGFALIVAGLAAYLAFQLAGRAGFGPMAPAPGSGRPGVPHPTGVAAGRGLAPPRRGPGAARSPGWRSRSWRSRSSST